MIDDEAPGTMGGTRMTGLVRTCRRALLLVASIQAFSLLGCSEPQPPSVMLIVVDTLRADAVSAYGGVEGTADARLPGR